jgi:hypothetical protein
MTQILMRVRKTQIAVEFCYRRKKAYPQEDIFWIHGDSEQRFKTSYLELGRKAGLWATSDDDEEGRLNGMKTWLERTSSRDWVLVIDELDDSDLKVNKYIPEGRGTILFTTRDKRLIGHEGYLPRADEGVEISTVDIFEDDDSDEDSILTDVDSLLSHQTSLSTAASSNESMSVREEALAIIAKLLSSSAISKIMVPAIGKLGTYQVDRRMSKILKEFSREIERRNLATEEIEKKSVDFLYRQARPIARKIREITTSTSDVDISKTFSLRLEEFLKDDLSRQGGEKVRWFQARDSNMAEAESGKTSEDAEELADGESDSENSGDEDDTDAQSLSLGEQALQKVSKLLESDTLQDLLLAAVKDKFFKHGGKTTSDKQTPTAAAEETTTSWENTPELGPDQHKTNLWPAIFAEGKTDITFDLTAPLGPVDRVKCLVESQLQATILWWPLAPPKKALTPESVRVTWSCVSDSSCACMCVC